ncbi:MAG TPA: hypothetical protein VLH79_07235 [Chthonomonadales bacterium]|nr:hypothetical protein [Chthonomonadales bacterium]
MDRDQASLRDSAEGADAPLQIVWQTERGDLPALLDAARAALQDAEG